MSKQEFLDRLKNALNGRVAPNQVQENINYYEDYINTQIRMGRKEQEVLDSLGDPRLIARTIIETSDQGRADTYSANEPQNTGYQSNGHKASGVPGWLWVLIVILVLIFILGMVFSVLTFLAPIILPILVVVFLVKLFRDWLN